MWSIGQVVAEVKLGFEEVGRGGHSMLGDIATVFEVEQYDSTLSAWK